MYLKLYKAWLKRCSHIKEGNRLQNKSEEYSSFDANRSSFYRHDASVQYDLASRIWWDTIKEVYGTHVTYCYSTKDVILNPGTPLQLTFKWRD